MKQPVDAQGTTSAREADGALASVRDRIREFRTVRAGDLLPDPRNPALHGDRQVSDVRANLADLGNLDVLKVVERPEGLVIVDGHLRRNLLADQEVRVAVLDLTPREQAKALLSFNRLAQLAEHDPLKVEALSVEVEDLSGTGYTVEEVRAEVADITADHPSTSAGGGTSLVDRFGVPPFSVLDARQGYWQDRKRQWLSLGIRSEVGRGEGLTPGESPQVTEPGLNYYRNRQAGRQAGRIDSHREGRQDPPATTAEESAATGQARRSRRRANAMIGGSKMPLDRGWTGA